MDSFDESLKFLLHLEPDDFVRFGFADPSVIVVRPCETDLPSRDRDIDGSYEVLHDGSNKITHVEFHRRHQGLDDLAVDVAEAQIRLYRRERKQVVSHVWDLYGSEQRPLLELRTLVVGPGTQSSYVRINLRAMTWTEFLAGTPSALWPLVPLTKDGASEIAVQAARDAIVTQGPENSSHLADHLAILWFVAEAEGVPTQLVQSYIQKAQLMESGLYKSIFEEAQALGEARGEARAHADTIYRLLAQRLGFVEPSVRQHLASWPHLETLEAWRDEAFALRNAKSARALLAKIMSTPAPSTSAASGGSSQAA